MAAGRSAAVLRFLSAQASFDASETNEAPTDTLILLQQLAM
jgi:hypothetical protein